ncbi:molybdopterin cofactor-binding domain-containing protein [Polymorphobacter sp.]|uniref:xanthine dehydrogenase family protein molybdopterin-binding subunit n=1 Tax=Polymorphobacter sp. TaxID=1909290 RepID=UPI003F6E4BA2
MALNRRSLLVASGVGAGLLLGWAAWPRRHPITWAAGPDEQLINAWVKLGLDGRVVVAVPQAEMGQGVWSGLAQILADELGADWRTVSVEPAPLGAAYVNAFLASEPLGSLPEMVRGVAGWTTRRVVEYFEVQLTGGSSSVRGFEAPLRAAGATAREMLCKAAAARLSVDWQDCDTANGFVIHKANRLSFADLAAEAARIDPPSEATLRPTPATANRLSGQPVLRLDVPSKVNGTARFGADVRLPGMAYAAIAQGPLGARRTGLDKSRLPAGCTLVEQPDFVAVVADGWWQAKTGLEALEINYQAAATPAGPWIDTALANAIDRPGALERKQVRSDDDAAGLIEAPPAGTISADYALPFLAHACMETMTATARIEDGRCEIWAPTQSITLANWAAARALDLPDEDVTVYPTLLGGGFGRKIENDAISQVARIARAAGRPVQLIWSREEDFAHDKFRPAAHGRLAARLEGTGTNTRIAALAVRIAAPDLGASVTGRNLPAIASKPKAGAGAFEGMVRLPYALPSLALEHVLVETPVPIGFWRSVGNSYTAFMMESFIDELALSADVDPLAFRLLHLAEQPRHSAVLRAVSTMSGGLGPIGNGDGSITGTGLALWESFGSIVAVIAEVLVRTGEVPRVIRLNIAADCGRLINPDSVRAQIEGGALYGLSAALSGRISFAEGEAEQRNFDSAPILDLASSPTIEITLIESDEAPGGAGEVATPPVAPAIANALASARVPRRRTLPLGDVITRKAA